MPDINFYFFIIQATLCPQLIQISATLLYCYIHFIQRFSKILAFPLRINSRKLQFVKYIYIYIYIYIKSTATNYKKMPDSLIA